jgi:hypothetical protein
MKTVVDPTFEYHKVMAELQGFVATRLANADLLPLDYATEATYWRLASADSKSSETKQLIDQWEQEAQNLLNDEKELLKNPNSGAKFSELNREIYKIARDFYRAEGFSGEPLKRNLFSKLSQLDKERNIYLEALKKRVQSLQAVRKQLKQMEVP